MEKISLYIKTISLVSMLAGVTTSLIPAGKLKSAYVSLSSVVLICSLIMPLSELEFDNEQIKFFYQEEISESIDAKIYKAEELIYQQAVSDAIVKKLSAEGINVAVEVNTACTDEALNITEIIIIGNVSEEEKVFISGFVSDSFKEAVTIFKEEESG